MQAKPSLSLKRKTLYTFIVFLLSLAVVVVLSELILRVFVPDMPRDDQTAHFFCRNRALDYRFMIPSVKGAIWSEEFARISVEANSNGYRDAEWSIKKNKPIMLLGDSFGWGWGCPKDSMIANVLDGQLGNYDIFNLCIPGDGFYNQFYRYKFHKDEINPKHIVLLFYINDLFHAKEQDSLITFAKNSGRFSSESSSIACDYFYDSGITGKLNKFYLYRFLKRLKYRNGISFSNESRRKAVLKTGFKDDVLLLTNSAVFERSLDKYENFISEISTDLRLTIVYIPPVYQLDTSKQKELLDLFELKTIGTEQIRNGIREVSLNLQNVDFIDLTDFLETKHHQSPMYFMNDGHLNSRGQRAVGLYLSKQLNLN